MSKKLLVITAGTVAAGVGQTLMKQMKLHPDSDFRAMIRYIDTAFLPDRYPTLVQGEWFQLIIDPRFMDAIYNKRDNYPVLRDMFFDGLLPGTESSGGGSIRYNGAGAIEVKREELRKWLSASMTELARAGDGDTNISIALVISAVGATGSGSIEHLINVIVDAAHFANIRSTAQSTIRCDVYILQPSQDVTDLGLANTLALYAELAASQLANTKNRAYQGRKVMIGWGSSRALNSIDQLREVAATIVRLSSNPSSSFAAEFREREVDNHVLRELDPITQLPTHLSLMTAVTISLGRLEEQVITRDVERLVESLVFESTEGGRSSNALLGRFADSLAGDGPEERYQTLLNYLSSTVHLADARKRLYSVANGKSTPEGEKADKLERIWQESKQEITGGRQRIQDFAHSFVAESLKMLEDAKGERICKGGVSLTELREEFRSFENILHRALEVAREQVQATISDGAVTRSRQELEGIWPFRLFNRKAKLQRLAKAIGNNLEDYQRQSCTSSAIMVLERLEQRCADVGQSLDIVLNKLRRQRDDQRRLTEANKDFSVETGNPFNISAMSTKQEMQAYAAKVSVFTSDTRGPEQLAEFRQWLQGRPALDALFKGNLKLLIQVVNDYTTEKVREAMKDDTVLDVLERAGEDALRNRLREAESKAIALVNYSRDFAPDLSEAWHVSAPCRENQGQHEQVNELIDEIFAGRHCKLLESNDPSEIALFYYVDGIPMSSVDDLKGRCLNAFLKRRQQWQARKSTLDGSAPVGSIGTLNQRVGVPIFSGQDAEDRVWKTNVIQKLYSVRGDEVLPYQFENEFTSPNHQNGNDASQPLQDLKEIDTSNLTTPHQNGNGTPQRPQTQIGNGTSQPQPYNGNSTPDVQENGKDGY